MNMPTNVNHNQSLGPSDSDPLPLDYDRGSRGLSLSSMQGHNQMMSRMLDLPQTNPFSKGRLVGAKNYVAAENYIIIEAITRRKGQCSWRDENIWKSVALEVSNSTTHDRTPQQLCDHFKKMVTAVRAGITELFVNTKLSWPTRDLYDDEELLHQERVIYINHLLNLMTGKSGIQSTKRFFSNNWWSDVVLLRLVELINSDVGKEFTGQSFMSLDRGLETLESNDNIMNDNRLSNGGPNYAKRKRDDMDDHDLSRGSMDCRTRNDLNNSSGHEEIQYLKQVIENLNQSLNMNNSNQKILEDRLRDVEKVNEDLRQEVLKLHDIVHSLLKTNANNT